MTALPTTPRGWVQLARDAIAALPDDVVRLDEWRCGTIACAGGHLAVHPTFNAAGLMADTGGAPTNRNADGAYDAMMKVMGIGWFDSLDMFSGRAEEELAFPGTDRELFLARCDAWLAKDAEGDGK